MRKQVETLKSELTALELRNGKIQVALPKPAKAAKKGGKPAEKAPPKKEEEKKEEAPKKQKEQKQKNKAPPKPAPADDKPSDVSRLSMKVGKIVECVKHPGLDFKFFLASNETLFWKSVLLSRR